jgi:DNA-binding transcriptional MerR regulator
MKSYTVKQLARLSGVSVRALHHYDEIGLLKPAFVGDNRYRYYGREELLRLQDILFHRELGVPLHEIGRALDDGGRDRLAMLEQHRERLLERMERSRHLIRTIDRTIAELKEQHAMKDKDLYAGFSPEEQAAHEKWLVDNFGDDMRSRIIDSRAAFAALDKDGQAARMAEGETAGAALAAAFHAGTAPDDPANDPLLARHHAWIAALWDRACPPQAYAGLANLYVEHPDFRANLDRAGVGFTDWMVVAMRAYAARQPASGE